MPYVKNIGFVERLSTLHSLKSRLGFDQESDTTIQQRTALYSLGGVGYVVHLTYSAMYAVI